MSFVDGELYERTIQTSQGTIDVLAEIVILETRIELRDIAVYPRVAGTLDVAPGELLSWVRLALSELADAGFEQLRVSGTRLSGSRRGRRIDLVIDLRRTRS